MQRGQIQLAFELAVLAIALFGCGKGGGAAAEQPSAGQGAAEQPAAEQDVKGSLKNGKPQGLFFMTRYANQMLEKSVWFFTADGHAYQNLSIGFSPDDLKAHQGPHGTFTVADNQMEITWSNGQKEKSPIEPDKTSFMWDLGIFSPVEPIRDAKSIAGKYEGGESLVRGEKEEQKTVRVARELQLGADGNFQLEGISLVEGESGSASDQARSSGTWDASGYTLTFKTGGKTLRQLAFPFDDETAKVHPYHLFVGGTLYKHLP